MIRAAKITLHPEFRISVVPRLYESFSNILGGADAARNLVEYCNHIAGYYSWTSCQSLTRARAAQSYKLERSGRQARIDRRKS